MLGHDDGFYLDINDEEICILAKPRHHVFKGVQFDHEWGSATTSKVKDQWSVRCGKVREFTRLFVFQIN